MPEFLVNLIILINLNLLAYLQKLKKELSVDASSMKIRDKDIFFEHIIFFTINILLINSFKHSSSL